MAEFTSAINNLTTLLIIIGGSLFTLCLAGGGILYMTAAGDPRKQEIARGAMLSSIVGVVILAMAPIAPRVLSRFVIEPSGGTALDRVGQSSCDATLRSALITQRGVSTASRANSMIAQIQAQRRSECSSETWKPKVGEATANETDACLSASGVASKIGNTVTPASLASAAKADEDDGITRDADGNILVNFSARPTDGSLCWLYLASADIWDQSAAKGIAP